MKLLKALALLATISFLFLLVSCLDETMTTCTELLPLTSLILIYSAEVGLKDIEASLILDNGDTRAYYSEGRWDKKE